MDEKINAGGKSPKALPKSLWQFALLAYADPIIQRHCLHLQDHYNLDVNMLLAAGYCSYRGRVWTPFICRDLMCLVAPIREANILPLRRIRRDAKGVKALYDALKNAEIAAEKMEIMALQEAIETRVTAVGGNTRYSDNILHYVGIHAEVDSEPLCNVCRELAAKMAKIR
ncbi:Uncharacterised protein [Zhongshania aliphaticivorans]|uniref:TIGR02444 family protein n=1 Tax=Zhongshania aliphaticivorans TaxID=1470434 RepID=A0A5S9PQK9_9GAMM|nr:TIGR02444 family protein [Zhongshania aliphaticivorans]CAA0106385.1 Uncharacterised protein [Zhongshania aliphaticivorans]CAA0106527.1 Uncharacterised protein [Zhongshania aliphaticivorans]